MQLEKWKRITTQGIQVAELIGESKLPVYIYAIYESRGYKTDFKPKLFFYFLCKSESGKRCIKGITKDVRRKTMKQYWIDKGITCNIKNKNLFNVYFE